MQDATGSFEKQAQGLIEADDKGVPPGMSIPIHVVMHEMYSRTRYRPAAIIFLCHAAGPTYWHDVDAVRLVRGSRGQQ